MSANTKIEWCDATVNHWAGCTAISPACDNCYAKRMAGRLWGTQWGPGEPRHQFAGADGTLRALDRKAKSLGRPLRVFHNSLSDFFDNEVPVQWRISAMRSIVETPNLIHILLTKRIGNAAEMLDVAFRAVHGQREKWADNVPGNVWLGATIVNQAEADRDIPKLLDVPARVRFLSMEPLLGPVDLTAVKHTVSPGFFGDCLEWHHRPHDERYAKWPGIDWVIVGGESGHGARPMHLDWVRSLRDQCTAAGVPFLFKQWGEWTSHEVDPSSYSAHVCCIDRLGRECALSRGESARAAGGRWWFLPPHPGRGTWGPDGIPYGVVEVRRIGKKAAGRLLDGREWNDAPEEITP